MFWWCPLSDSVWTLITQKFANISAHFSDIYSEVPHGQVSKTTLQFVLQLFLTLGKERPCVSLEYVPSSRPETVCGLVIHRGDPSRFLLMLCKQGSRHFSNYLYIYKSNTVMGKTNKHSLVEQPAMKYHWLYNNLLQLFFLFTLDRKCFHLTHGIRIYTTQCWVLL